LGLGSYLIRRAINSFIIVFGAIILVFLLTHVIAPNPAAVWAGPHATKLVIQNVEKEYHLNAPVYVQLYYYLQEVFTLNFGTSPYFKVPVLNLIEVFYPRTLELDFIAMAVTIGLGVYTGAFAAAHKDKAGDQAVKGFYLVTWSAPPFLVALILQFFFAYSWGLLPVAHIANPGLALPPPVTGFLLIDALVAGNYAVFYSSLVHLVLPVASLSLISFGIITRIMRSSMLEALRTEYVRTAIMKGATQRRVVYFHALRNSLIPVITVIALTFAYLIAGSVVIEEVFSYEGMGYLITQALYNFDYPTLIASTIVITITVVAINFAADVLYGLVDPRIRLSGGKE
jgi:peptide/nickel transport system permease protein